MSFRDRFTQDLKSSGPKTAALAIITLVGLYLWIPPLWRMVVKADGTLDETAGSEATVDGATTTAATNGQEGTARSSRLNWEMAEKIRANHLLFRGASPHELKQDAFVLSSDSLPIEVEFAIDPPPTLPAVAEASSAAKELADAESENGDGNELAPETRHGLTLQSTLVGGRGRKALINRQIYSEGDEIAVNGRLWTLVDVSTRSVVLQDDREKIELRIAPFELKQAQLKR